MTRRKVVFFLISILCLILWGPQTLLSGVCFSLKAYLSFTRGWELQFDRATWQDQTISFANLSLQGDSSFSLASPQVDIHFKDRKIVLTHPRATILSLPRDETSFSWDLVVINGSLNEGSVINAEISRLGRFAGRFERVNLSTLSFLWGDVWQGVAEGTFELKKTQKELWQGVLHSEVRHFHGGRVLQKATLGVNWEGIYDAAHIDLQGCLRLHMEEGRVTLGRTCIERIRGDASFHGPIGAAWQFAGVCEGDAISWAGKGMLRNWAEATLALGESSLFLQAQKEGEEILLDAEAAHLTPRLASLAQECMRFFAPESSLVSVGFEEGVLSGKGQVRLGKEGVMHSDLSSLHAVNCRVKGKDWSAFCQSALLQDGAYSFEGFAIGDLTWQGCGCRDKNEGSLSFTSRRLQGTIDFTGTSQDFQGILAFQGPVSGTLPFTGSWQEFLRMQVQGGACTLFSSVPLTQITGVLQVDSSQVSLFDVRALARMATPLSLYIPILQTDGVFDVRLQKGPLELLRLAGESHNLHFQIDPAKSYCGDMPVASGCCEWSQGALQTLLLDLTIPSALSREDDVRCHLAYTQGTFDATLYASDKRNLRITKSSDMFHLEKFTFDEWSFSSDFAILENGTIEVSSIILDLAALHPSCTGALQGSGLIQLKSHPAADFDFHATPLTYQGLPFENRGSLHVHAALSEGISLRGVNLIADAPDASLHCKAGLIQYNHREKTCRIFDMHGQSRGPIWQKIDPRLESLQDDFRWAGDAGISLDPLHFSLALKEGEMSSKDKTHSIENLSLETNGIDVKAQMSFLCNSLWVPMDLTVQLGAVPRGQLVIQQEFVVDGFYDGALHIQSIEGDFLGMQASFREDQNSLIGRASLNCHELAKIVPPKIVDVFRELKLGDGYEAKGRLSIGGEGLSFQGTVTGKDAELFGFQLKTISTQLEFSPTHVAVTDFKASDAGGTLTIPQVEAKGTDEIPWTLDIPLLAIHELRPSLLHAPGKALDPLTPLVVRELKLEHLHGLLEESKTYEAKGELHFINSYKRSNSILELPADLLSRIVGLDLDLLVPVKGTLRYELKGGKFHLTELANAFSENERSEFFLVFNEDGPTVDLDWNLNILIQMKQFVLFKFTEAFLISVTGTLEKPEFHLQSKKRVL